ncbi:MAG: hypothetical protein KGY69_13920, partial [Bacteroidales bacterium]|nr:hypothetical protein [Bacteroidales bacterium]
KFQKTKFKITKDRHGAIIFPFQFRWEVGLQSVCIVFLWHLNKQKFPVKILQKNIFAYICNRLKRMEP